VAERFPMADEIGGRGQKSISKIQFPHGGSRCGECRISRPAAFIAIVVTMVALALVVAG